MHKVIIIGTGPAGATAAIYLKRAQVNALVIGKDNGALENYQGVIENYYGLANPISGNDLIENGLFQMRQLDIKVIKDVVLSIEKKEDFFIVTTQQARYEGKSVLLATGKSRMILSVKGFKDFFGKGISLCAQCDGYFFRNKKIALIGTGYYMKHELEYLKQISNDITVFTNNQPLEVEIDVPVNHEKILAFKGESKISFIETTENHYDVFGVFIAIGTPSSTQFAKQLGIIMDNQSIVVDALYQTNIKGLYAVGDMIGGKLQIAKAVYDGMCVSDSIINFLKE